MSEVDAKILREAIATFKLDNLQVSREWILNWLLKKASINNSCILKMEKKNGKNFI